MNWQKIKEEYPHALYLFIRWATKGEYDGDKIEKSQDTFREGFFIEYQKDGCNYFVEEDIRCLYDFFDENGIYVNVFRIHYYEDNVDNTLHEYYDWQIIKDLDIGDSGEVEEPTRTEAEEQAFMKAFEILEEKLK